MAYLQSVAQPSDDCLLGSSDFRPREPRYKRCISHSNFSEKEFLKALQTWEEGYKEANGGVTWTHLRWSDKQGRIPWAHGVGGNPPRWIDVPDVPI